MPPEGAELRAHREWIGYVQPVGIVVSPPALLKAQAQVERNIASIQDRLRACVVDVPLDDAPNPVPAIASLTELCTEVFGWEPADLIGAPGNGELPPELEVSLPEYDEVLRPTYAVADPEPANERMPWLLLIQEAPAGTDLDRPPGDAVRHWDASPTARLERLLRETRVPAGLLSNGTHLRLVYAPRGETSGHMTFPVSALCEVSGRPILGGLHMLLRSERLFTLPTKQRLPAILEDSRRFQADVSTRLAGQVLEALYELLRGFQSTDTHTKGELLGDVLRAEPDHVYEGLLTVLLRSIFLLYAEDRGLLPAGELFLEHYGIGGLYERLREDAAHHPDTMDQRYGAWAQLLSLFRLVHDGGGHGDVRLPRRHGYLFDPDRYAFLEGRPWRSQRVMGERIDPPLISDGVVHQVLEKLLVLDGERLSYRTLDVEEIGSIYETMMGFRLEVARGRSIAVKPAKTHGAPVTLDLDALLKQSPSAREKWFRDRTDVKPAGGIGDGLKAATTPEDVVAALGSKVARAATPAIVPPGAMVLQPNDERRRSGTHYTPRALTEPIVRTTLRPVLEALGPNPAPERILELKVLDPAMGSGAFLVEACRQLGEELVRSWHAHGRLPSIPAADDELIHAMRVVAQRCLYGVDRNPIAADLGKLSLWLATLAGDHAFTFLNHAFRPGDSLVGLTRKQIAAFHWEPTAQIEFVERFIGKRLKEASRLRAEIRTADVDTPESELRHLLNDADDALDDIRLIGDLAVGAFFSADKPRARKDARDALAEQVRAWLAGDGDVRELSETARELREERAVTPFHWEIEFPEVFERENPGFDAIVGNPPFLGGKRLSTELGPRYRDWLIKGYEESNANSDIVSFFFRRCFALLNHAGTFGLLATNTIAQGDTRETGLKWICQHGGRIAAARRRLRWPGAAAVIVSVVHISKDGAAHRPMLDGQPVDRINAFLLQQGPDEKPSSLTANAGVGFVGYFLRGQGFVFEPNPSGESNDLAAMRQLVSVDPQSADVILPYIGGEELNTSPTSSPHRYAIFLPGMSEASVRQRPVIWEFLSATVRPERERLGDSAVDRTHKANWWRYANDRPALRAALKSVERVVVTSLVSQHFAFTFLPSKLVFSHKLGVFIMDRYSHFSVMQGRTHEIWARSFSSTLEDRLNYSPSDCFETFPFPEDFENIATLEAAGRVYYDFRTELMVRNGEGLTKTYNRFHDPNERSVEIRKLRQLHDAMDRAVLDTYGWTEIQPQCVFLLDYEDEEDEEASSRRRKPWRYRWPDEVRDEVLARLLALNAERAEQERLLGEAAARGRTRGSRSGGRGGYHAAESPSLFDAEG